MSYILDALRKSEEQRRRGTVPDVLAVQRMSKNKANENRFLSFFLLAVLLLNACLLIWWLSPWHPTRHEAAGGNTNVPGSKTTAVSPANPTKQNLQGGPASKAHAAMRKEGTGTASNGRADTGSALSVSMPQPPGKQPASDLQTGNLRPDGVQKLISLNELPLSIQQSLPELSISVHYYVSNPASRMVNVNNRTMREGEELTSGLKLEEITQDGAIFSYQDYRFHIGLK